MAEKKEKKKAAGKPKAVKKAKEEKKPQKKDSPKKPEAKHGEKKPKAKKPGEEKAKAVKREKKKPEKISKPKEVKKLSKLVRAKKRHMFRGRFGKRSVRKVSKKKWQKWRKPRGIDIYFKKEDGLVPGTGYMTAKRIRFVHPSGYRERLVKNMQDLLDLEQEKQSVAARISAKLGKKKKTEIVKKASEKGIVVLNR